MQPVIHFQSRLFKLSSEPQNPINPIPGWSLLDWLRGHIPALSEPAPEDWGWYSYLDLDGRQYLIGACAHQNTNEEAEWILQIDKIRSLKEKLFRQARMTATDPCFQWIYQLIQQEPGFSSISVENGPKQA